MVSKKREPDSAGPDSKKQKRSDSDPQENEINWYKPGDINRKWGKKWGRPEGSMNEDLVFQQIDLDKYVEFVDGEPKPTIRIYGTDKRGSSVCLFVNGFQPYFYTPAPEGFTEDYCGQFVPGLRIRAKIFGFPDPRAKFFGLPDRIPTRPEIARKPESCPKVRIGSGPSSFSGPKIGVFREFPT